MADINGLTNSVIEREQAKVDQAVRAYEQEQAAETETKRDEIKQAFVKRKFNLEQDSKRQLDISLNSARLKQRDQILDSKQVIINDYIAQVKKSFQQLDAKTTTQFIEGILNDYTNPEQYEIVLGEKTHDLLNNSLQVKAQVSNETVAGKAGFLLRQGSIEYNYLFDNLVEEKTSSLQRLIVDKIFKTS
ncbi:hypothetical protein HYQ40_06325 [Aerococcaceae bacterium DSM 111021]|nr:hypothetical protein [Aerococcaceae bacterium DSM 111021]